MSETTKDIQDLLNKLYAKENKLRRYTLLYLGVPIVLGLFLIFWTVWQAENLKTTTKKVQSLNTVVDADKVQLAQARMASDYIREGINNAHAKNFTAAIHSYDKAIELDPLNPVAFNLKGYTLLRKGEVQGAIKALKRSAEIDPAYVWAHYNLALAYWASGEQTHAIDEVRNVLEIDPSFSYTIKKDGQFNEFRKLPAFRSLMEK